MSSGVDPIIQRELKLNQGQKQANYVMKKMTGTTTEHHQIQEDKIQQKLTTVVELIIDVKNWTKLK